MNLEKVKVFDGEEVVAELLELDGRSMRSIAWHAGGLVSRQTDVWESIVRMGPLRMRQYPKAVFRSIRRQAEGLGFEGLRDACDQAMKSAPTGKIDAF